MLWVSPMHGRRVREGGGGAAAADCASSAWERVTQQAQARPHNRKALLMLMAAVLSCCPLCWLQHVQPTMGAIQAEEVEHICATPTENRALAVTVCMEGMAAVH